MHKQNSRKIFAKNTFDQLTACIESRKAAKLPEKDIIKATNRLNEIETELTRVHLSKKLTF